MARLTAFLTAGGEIFIKSAKPECCLVSRKINLIWKRSWCSWMLRLWLEFKSDENKMTCVCLRVCGSMLSKITTLMGWLHSSSIAVPSMITLTWLFIRLSPTCSEWHDWVGLSWMDCLVHPHTALILKFCSRVPLFYFGEGIVNAIL